MENKKPFDAEEYLDEVANTLKKNGYSCFIVTGDEKEGNLSNLYIVMKGHVSMLFSGLNKVMNSTSTDLEVKDLLFEFSKNILKARDRISSVKRYVRDFVYLLGLLTLCFLFIGNLSINYGVNKELMTMIVFIIMAMITSPLFRSKLK